MRMSHENMIILIENHYKTFGYEKAHYLKELLQECLGVEFKLDGEVSDESSNKS